MTKEKEQKTETALATVNTSSYAIVQAGGLENMAALQANLGGEQLDVTDLDRVGIPSGGGLQWEIPTLDGEESVKSIEGVIVCHRIIRLFWKEGIEDGGSGNPPDCISNDAVEGKGDPGGSCDKCPYAEFGSAKNGEGRGQACKKVHQLFIMRKQDMLPLVINLPPSSLKHIKKYLLRVALQGKPFYQVITRLELDRTQNKDQIKYSIVKPTFVGVLDETSAKFFEEMHRKLTPILLNIVIDGSEYVDDQPEKAPEPAATS